MLHQRKYFLHTGLDHAGQCLTAQHAGPTVTQTRHFHLRLRVRQQLFGTTAFHLDVFRIFGRGAQCHGNVTGDEVARNRDDRRVADGSTRENRHVRGACANVYQRHAQFAFVRCQDGLAAGQRVEHELVHFQPTTSHALDDVFSCTLCAGHDVHLGFQTDATHANGLFHILAVDHKLLRLHQQQALVGGDVDGLGGFDHPGHICRCDLAARNGDHAAGVDATDMAAGDAGGNPGNAAVGHQLGLFQRLLDALHGGVNVDHHTALETIAGRHAQAGQLQLPIGGDFGHHHHDLRRTDVETNHQIFVFLGHDASMSVWMLKGLSIANGFSAWSRQPAWQQVWRLRVSPVWEQASAWVWLLGAWVLTGLPW